MVGRTQSQGGVIREIKKDGYEWTFDTDDEFFDAYAEGFQFLSGSSTLKVGSVRPG